MHSRAGFTLLELMLVVMIGVMILLLVVPSVSGIFAERKMRERLEAFDDLVRLAHGRSLTERRTWVLAWEKEAVVARPAEAAKEEDEEQEDENEPGEPEAAVEPFQFSEDEKLTITFPAAMIPPVEPVWTFWPTGTCEPALVSYDGPAGAWVARYDPLTARAVLEKSDVK